MGNSIPSSRAFQRIFDATARIDAAKSIAQVLGELRRGLDTYGFKSCLIANLPRQDMWSFDQHILINAWPRNWHSRYNQAGFYRFDPCVAVSRRATCPFLWSDVSQRLQVGNARRVMDEATEFGLRDGVCVPIEIDIGDGPGVVTVAGSSVDLGPTSRCCVHALGRHAYFAASRILGSSRPASRRGLTQREREILRWTAAGKTAWEISTILGVAESTINTHLRSVRQKLDAANIVHAIVEAIRRHEISI
jgi:LuxR family quorum sensing-dependent transcriptional regulator